MLCRNLIVGLFSTAVVSDRINLEDLIVYKIIYSAVDENPEIARKLLKRLVGASGFEPPTSWSRTRRSSQAEPRPDQIQCRLPGGWEQLPVSPGYYLSR